MDIVMVTRDRPELTEQCIRSMRENAADWSRHRLVVVFDGTAEEMIKLPPPNLKGMFARGVLAYAVVATGEQLGVGGAKNYGAAWFRGIVNACRTVEPPALLMFSDNDMWYGPGWDAQLEAPFKHTTGHAPHGPTQLGGWRHPYHALGRTLMWVGGVAVSGDDLGVPARVYEVDAVTGNCFVIRWSDWLKYGPFDSNAIGPGQSEDYALSQRIRAGGGLVATLDPPVAIHCGLVNSIGEPATGWRECEEQITEQLAGLSAEMRESVLIMRPAPDSVVQRLSKMRQMGLDPAAVYAAFEGVRKGLDMQPREATADQGGTTLTDINERWNRNVVERIARPRQPSVTAAKLDVYVPPVYIGSGEPLPTALNIASGQRPFRSTTELIWYNVDRQRVPPDRIPDIMCNVGVDPLPFADNSVQYVVIHQGLEHAGCGESEPMLLDCWRVLARGGSLIITVPDMRKLAARWLGGEMDTQLYMTNVYGAYMGDEADRHKWGFDAYNLLIYLGKTLMPETFSWATYIKQFDWRAIPGADIAHDWWVLGVEVVKP